MIIREANITDAEKLYEMLCRLDEETDYMMYEPGERQKVSPNSDRLKSYLEEASSGTDLMLVAENDSGEIVGFLGAERGKLNRVQHTAYIVTGIREAYRRQGIGTRFFKQLEEWARSKGIVRLELTVECPNIAAKNLYEKNGFVVEGLRSKSMRVNGEFVDEYNMCKIIDL